MHKFILLSLLVFTLCSCSKRKTEKRWIASAPAGDRYAEINRNGVTVIPNGRLLTPVGNQITVAPHPFGLAVSDDGNTIVTANSGTGPFSITVIRNYNSASPSVKQIPEHPDKDLLEAVFMGLAIAPDNQTIYVAGGQENKIHIFDLNSGKKLGAINCNKTFDGTDYSDGYIGDIAMSKDGSTIYAVDQIGFRLIIADTRTRQVIHNVPTGRYPFGVELSPDGKTVYVANIGMFEYSYIKSLDIDRLKETSLPFPAFGFNTRQMREGIKNDSIDVSGLGDPNVPESFSVWAIDVGRERPEVISKIKTGVLVGELADGINAVGGSAPNSMVASDRYLFVSNGNNDNISVIDPAQDSVIHTIDLQLDPRLGRLKGVIPFGLAISPDQKSIYVAEAGINAVGVIDTETLELTGHIPTGWFPSKVKVTPDGKQLIVSNAKGFGSGPNGGRNFVAGPQGNYIGSLMKGTVTVADIPSGERLKELSAKVVENNFAFREVSVNDEVSRPDSSAGPIKYIVFISKENRTYDQIFGQLRNGRGDSSLAIYGQNISFFNRKKDKQVTNATVMPNHLALAGQFAISDNFYVDSDVSADGHVWLTNTYPNQWMETHQAASRMRKLKPESKAPGKFGFTGAAGAIFPEDYNQHGSMWDHLHRNKIEFYNFGFGAEFDAGNYADSTLKYGGVRYLVNYPLPGPLYDRTSRLFPTFNMAIPDQFRADVFIKEITDRYITPQRDLPSVITMQLLNDHGARERPHAGFPFNESYMSDNDLALGRVIEFLTHTSYWKNMMIVVTEDDAQGGNDHVDAHRSMLMVVSPYVKRNFSSHAHYSFGSIFKTFWNVLGIPYLNQYDFGTNSLSDCFTDEPDYTPYTAVPVDRRIFDPQKALDPFDEEFEWEAAINSPKLDDPDDIQKAREEDERMRSQK